MLAEFRVKGFKNFKEEINFKLDETKNYEFNKEAIKNGINKISMIYGGNGSGKSNLGLAIFDIVMSLTDKTKQLKYYENYLNLTDSVTEANFYYKFIFGKDVLEYSYSKTNKDILIAEEVLINNQKVITYNHKESKGEVKLKGTETLNTSLGNPISFVKYVMNNSALGEDKNNDVMKKFYDFVQNMLFFRSLRGNEYIGFTTGNGSITEKIIDSGKLKEFEDFLRAIGINYNLIVREEGDKKLIFCKFGKKEVNFFDIASTGTEAFALFYAWFIDIDKASFVFMDEFDAFYHNDLSKIIVKKLLKMNTQVILTTHNTGIMNNGLLRPDCYFLLKEGKIKTVSDLTDKELRKAHNLEKMYRAGAFS